MAVLSIPLTTFNPGTTLLTGGQIPVGNSAAEFAINRNVGANPLTVLGSDCSMSFEYSEDNVNWQPMGSVTFPTGPKLAKDGVSPLLVQFFNVHLFGDPTNPSRFVRGSFTCDRPISLSGSLTLS